MEGSSRRYNSALLVRPEGDATAVYHKRRLVPFFEHIPLLPGAWAERVGGRGRGIPTIIEMGNYTRLDCCIGSSGLMRQAVAQAVHHARYRSAFQKKLIDQPLMENVLADLCLESEAATASVMRLARAYDEAAAGDGDDPAGPQHRAGDALGADETLYNQTVRAIRSSLRSGLKTVFLIGAITMLAAFCIILTIPEISMDADVRDTKPGTV